MLDDIKRANSVAFVASVSFSGDAQPFLPESTFTDRTLAVAARRPADLRIQDITTIPEGAETVVLRLYDLFISNGRRQIEIADGSDLYSATDTRALLADIRGTKGLTVAIAPGIVFAADPLAGFRYYGNGALGGAPSLIFSRSQLGTSAPVEQRIYLSGDGSSLLRYAEFASSGGREPAEQWRVDFSKWVINPEFPDAMFDPTPPVGAGQ